MKHNPEPEQNLEKRQGQFTNTHWRTVVKAKGGSETALNWLFTRYREPLFVHLRGQGYAHHDAEDLQQGFSLILLKRNFLMNVDQDKGRFRNLLLTALDRYCEDVRRKRGARKRGGGEDIKSLDETDGEGAPLHAVAAPTPTAYENYNRAWASTLLANAFQRLREECARSGHAALFDALEPVFFQDEDAEVYREIAQRLNTTEGAVKVSAHRLRARLRFLIRDEIRQTVSNEAEWEEECKELMGLFIRGVGGK